MCCYTAEHKGLTQNRLQLLALCKSSVFSPPIACNDLVQEWQSEYVNLSFAIVCKCKPAKEVIISMSTRIRLVDIMY